MNIVINNMEKKYHNKTAIKNINLQLIDGSFTAIVGPSGCGKTTLMRCLAGFLEVDKGTILFGDQEVTQLPPQKRGAAMVFQNYALWPHMTVFENIAYGLKIKKVPKPEIEQKVYAMLEKVEIDPTDVKKRYPSQYSGGQQQRIALARALVLQPKLLLMDEPLSNLDAKIRQRLRVEIRRLQQELGITAVYVTHDQEEALSMADQVVVMNKGLIEQSGSPEMIYNQPQTYFVAHFLGNSNTLAIKKKNEAFFLGAQIIPLLADQTTSGEEYQLVFRANDASLCFEWSARENDVILKGILKEGLFVGTGYRYWIEVEGQNCFVESEQRVEGSGECYISIPKEKCFLFLQAE